jgi:hypothetical protein
LVVSFDLNEAGTSAVDTLTSGATTAGVAGASYPATGAKETLLESPVNDEVLTESLLEKHAPLENDDVKHGSNEAGAKVAAGANDAPPSPTDPILSLITFKSPSFEWSGAPLLKQQLCQALAVLFGRLLDRARWQDGGPCSREFYRDSCSGTDGARGRDGTHAVFTVSNLRFPGLFATLSLVALLNLIFPVLQFCGMTMGGFPPRPLAAKMRASISGCFAQNRP